MARRSGVIVHRPMATAGRGAEAREIDFRVDLRGLRVLMPQDIADIRHRGAAPQQIGRQRVAQEVRAVHRGAHSRPGERDADEGAHRARMSESPMRCTRPHKDAARGTARSIALQVGGHGLADIARQRELTADRSFSAHEQLTGVPIDVVELQSDDFAPAQTQSREQQQDGVIAPADRRGARTRVEHPLHVVGRQVLRHVDEAPSPDRWNRRRQIALGLPRLPQKPEKGAQRRRMELRTGRRAAGICSKTWRVTSSAVIARGSIGTHRRNAAAETGRAQTNAGAR